MNEIETTGTAGGSISTDKRSGESTNDWVGRHNAAVETAGPDGDDLTTTWTSANGPQSVTTKRSSGESDTAFTLRHIEEYVTEMGKEPPIP